MYVDEDGGAQSPLLQNMRKFVRLCGETVSFVVLKKTGSGYGRMREGLALNKVREGTISKDRYT